MPPAVGPAPAPAVEPPPPAGTPADAAALLQSAQRMLDRGEADRALDLLEQLQAREPTHAEARALTIRLLRNRALVRYGQGQLEEAASDWARVVDLDPQDAQAQRFLRAARSELDERRRR
jgi:tetratricopeptide (TPR) repeat protein